MANEVRMEKLDGAWTVFVVENGQTNQRTFETKQFAKSYAAGQRIRLGLLVARRKTLDGEAGIIDGNEM
jgi:hypothetical protein